MEGRTEKEEGKRKERGKRLRKKGREGKKRRGEIISLIHSWKIICKILSVIIFTKYEKGTNKKTIKKTSQAICKICR